MVCYVENSLWNICSSVLGESRTEVKDNTDKLLADRLKDTTTDPWILMSNWIRQRLWHPDSVPWLNLGHQRACKTIVCHFVTRTWSFNACKHTTVPLVTRGAVSPLCTSSLPLLPWAHMGVRATGCQCLLCYSSGLVITLLSEGGGGGCVTVM